MSGPGRRGGAAGGLLRAAATLALAGAIASLADAVRTRPGPAGTGGPDGAEGPPGERDADQGGQGAGGPDREDGQSGDRAPGDRREAEAGAWAEVRGYLVGLGLATLLTAASFYVASGSGLVWKPGVPVVLVVLAIAQMGVHLVFFLHITTAPDNTNNVLALAFGTLIVILLIGGSLWIMANLNHSMMPMDHLMKMQR